MTLWNRLFSEGVKNSPQYVPLYQGWALLEMRDGNYQASRKLITEALTRNKKNGHGWLVAAEIEEAAGNSGLVNLLLRRGIEVREVLVILFRPSTIHFVQLTSFDFCSALQAMLSCTEPLAITLQCEENSMTYVHIVL